jgi:hypothetical protein
MMPLKYEALPGLRAAPGRGMGRGRVLARSGGDQPPGELEGGAAALLLGRAAGSILEP